MAFEINNSNPIYDILRLLEQNHCINRVGINITEDNTYTANVDVIANVDAVNLIIEPYKNRLSNYKIGRNGAHVELSIVSKERSILNYKINKTVIFKSIYKDIVDIHKNCYIPTDIVPPLQIEKDSVVFIKRCESIYEDDGWTVRDIFDKLGVDVIFPSSWNYHVTNFQCKAWTPIVQIIQNLFPVPGVVVKTFGSFFMVVFGSGVSYGFDTLEKACIKTVSEKTMRLHLSVYGDVGKAKYFNSTLIEENEQGENDWWDPNKIKCGDRFESTLIDSNSEIKMEIIKNKLNGVFGVETMVVEKETDVRPSGYWHIPDEVQ